MKSEIQKIVNKIYKLQYFYYEEMVTLAGEVIDFIWKEVVESEPRDWVYISIEDAARLVLPTKGYKLDRLDCLNITTKLLNKINRLDYGIGFEEKATLEEVEFWSQMDSYMYALNDIVDFKEKL